MSHRSAPLRRWLWWLTAVVLLLFTAMLVWQRARALSAPSAVQARAWVGAEVCQDCHTDRHASWHRTYHRTMTQDATPLSVVGVFDGRTLHADGTTVQPVLKEGRPWFQYLDAPGGRLIGAVEIVRTVGSHRYQQYLGRAGGNDYRLEFLWHIGDQRWVPLNAAFLHPDGLPGDHSVALWNQNCIYCHNTGPQPGLQNYAELAARARSGERVDINTQAQYESQVAELGISCEACHGPGSDHISRTASWLDRQVLGLWPGADPAIVLADRLDATRSSQICAQCHAQRLPLDTQAMREWLHSGPSYRAGMDLDQHVRVVQAHTPSPDASQPDLYRLRFWADGSPRLSAYEWQGMQGSACFEGGQLSCQNCHAMHAGDPAGMITERQRGDAPCLACHQDLAADPQAHTRHAPGTPGAHCKNCHMPWQVYGVMSIQRSHRISVPDPALSATSGAPNACTLCHVDQSLEWVADQLAAGWGRARTPLPARADGADPALADALAGLRAGDAAQQAIWAERLGAADTGYALSTRQHWVPWLSQALGDAYPSTRRFAQRSLLRLAEDPSSPPGWRDALAAFDFVAPTAERALALDQLQTLWSQHAPTTGGRVNPTLCLQADGTPDPVCSDTLRALHQRPGRLISIGE